MQTKKEHNQLGDQRTLCMPNQLVLTFISSDQVDKRTDGANNRARLSGNLETEWNYYGEEET